MGGLDISHVSIFATRLHDTSQECHVPGTRIRREFGGGTLDFDLIMARLGRN